MTRNYIMTHTPAQIAAENSAADILREFNTYAGPFTLDTAADLYSNNAVEDRANDLPNEDWCEQLLVEWYDECEREREYTADELSMAYHLYAAYYLRYCADEQAEE